MLSTYPRIALALGLPKDMPPLDNTKVVLMRDGQVSAFAICDTGFNSADSAQTAMELALSQAGWESADLA